MRIACTNINNNGIVLNKSLVDKAIFKYNGILGRSLYKLYDMGYQSSPAILDIGDFRTALKSDFPEDITLLRDNLRGKIDIGDESMLIYASLMTKDDDFRDLILCYLDILRARKALDAYDKLLSKVKIPKRKDTFKVKVRLGVSGSVHNYNSLPLDNEAVMESFELDSDEKLVHVDTSHVIIKEIVKKLGYSDDVYLEHKNSGQPFFLKGVSQDDESKLLPIIMSGKVFANGRFGAELVKDISKYYNDFYSIYDSRIHCLNYEEVIFNNALDERISLINEEREKLKNSIFREFYVTGKEVIFAVKSESYTSSKSYFENNMIHVGAATLSHENRNEFSKINTLSGLCGEFIHEGIVRDKGWIAEGNPISIKFGLLSGKRFKLSFLNYYPVYNVYYNNGGVKGSNIRPLLGNDIHIVVSDWDETLKKLGVSSRRDLYNKFLKDVDVDLPYYNINRLDYEGLIADLATALVCAECGMLDYKMYGSDFSWVTDEIFYRASVEAEALFRSFGF